ncbi:FAD-dependent oxidoreductase [Kitasatospora arboriphila]
MSAQTTDVLVIGSGFGGAIPAYHLAASGARVTVLERGPRLAAGDFTHDLRLGGYTRIVDVIKGDGISVVASNCVGGGSVVYFAASLRAPSFVFERRGGLRRRIWPSRADPRRTRPLVRPGRTVPAGHPPRLGLRLVRRGVLAAACHRAGRTCNPVPVAVDTARCTDCNWMLSGCRFDAKRSMLLNYLPAAEAHGAEVRPLHEVQAVVPSWIDGHRYAVTYTVLDPSDYGCTAEIGTVHAKVVVLAAGAVGTPVVLQRSAPALGGIPRPSAGTSPATATGSPSPRWTRPRCATCWASPVRTAPRTPRCRSASPSPPRASTTSTAPPPSSADSRSSRSTSRRSPTRSPGPPSARGGSAPGSGSCAARGGPG